ncbi:large subunit GTPase 1 homolog isoform X2 [Uloborus diversus]|uniref:large subunit GTPase 1 homolog isoform X2 n=1 Tax=Uloborus diversus TaxID=327109 RepID=UPI00240A2CCE|nr:large subunit GTPase 1 homolog isoform X2 [Uloborus diversus]
MPKKDPALGRCLIRAHKKRSNFVIRDGYRHTSDLLDGRDFGKLNLNSVTEQSSLDDFLDKAALAEKEYNEEFADIRIVEADVSNGILSEEEKILISEAQEKNKEVLCIPRRPSWNADTSKEELEAKEREAFLLWRRKLALVQEEQHINLTPYEKNLEVWRQLWRVIERSDVVVQILDARNPLLFRCPDLEAYVKEINESKLNVLLLNKADFLTENERQCWCEYFEKTGVQIAFFSALQEIEKNSEEDFISEKEKKSSDFLSIKNDPKILSRDELIYFFKSICKLVKDDGISNVGLVGYPNVGKSSTINAILMSKKVSVSATPGKTKHFQTFIVDNELCLCDCPGLVFPNFVSTKAEMVINGILPIDQLTNWVHPVSLITKCIPRHILQSTYSVLIPAPAEGAENVHPTAEEFLNAHGYNRGFMTQRGLPDNARSARYILKDFVNGRLLYCHAPPGVNQEDYHKFPEAKLKKIVGSNSNSEIEFKPIVLSEADKKFFSKTQVHFKGKPLNTGEDESCSKPWKKHYNRNKKEKLRKKCLNPYD